MKILISKNEMHFSFLKNDGCCWSSGLPTDNYRQNFYGIVMHSDMLIVDCKINILCAKQK